MNSTARNGWAFHIAVIIMLSVVLWCLPCYSGTSCVCRSEAVSPSTTTVGTISLDTSTLSSTTQTDWKDKYTTLVNGVETIVKKASETMNAAKTALGDPVDMVSGEFYTEETPDFLIKSRGLDLSIIRKYTRLGVTRDLGSGLARLGVRS